MSPAQRGTLRMLKPFTILLVILFLLLPSRVSFFFLDEKEPKNHGYAASTKNELRSLKCPNSLRSDSGHFLTLTPFIFFTLRQQRPVIATLRQRSVDFVQPLWPL